MIQSNLSLVNSAQESVSRAGQIWTQNGLVSGLTYAAGIALKWPWNRTGIAPRVLAVQSDAPVKRVPTVAYALLP